MVQTPPSGDLLPAIRSWGFLLSRRRLQAQVTSTQAELMENEQKTHLHVLRREALRVGSKQEESCLQAEEAGAGTFKAQAVALAGASVSLGVGFGLEGEPVMTGQMGVLASHRTPDTPAKSLIALFG